MRTIKTLLATLALFVASTAQATVLDFEDLIGQGSVPAGYGGITWGSTWDYYNFSQWPYNASSGVVRLYNNGTDDAFSFASDVIFNGAFFAGYNTAQFELYNDGILVHVSSILDLSETPTFLAAGYAGLIDEVRLNVDNGSFVMDDLSFNNNAIPEPMALSLMGLGLAAMGLSRRRRI